MCEGTVGARVLGRFRAFRYEVRCWPDGHIPDLAEAVDGPQRVCTNPDHIGTLLTLISATPTLTWGRDELGCGDMWNSNSLVAWLLAATGHDMSLIAPPQTDGLPGGKRDCGSPRPVTSDVYAAGGELPSARIRPPTASASNSRVPPPSKSQTDSAQSHLSSDHR